MSYIKENLTEQELLEISNIENLIKQKKDAMKSLNTEIVELRNEYMALTTGFRIGDNIKHKGHFGVVSGYDWSTIKVRHYMKDNTLALTEQYVYNLKDLQKCAKGK